MVELRTNDRVSMRGFSVAKKEKKKKREKKRSSFPLSQVTHTSRENELKREEEIERQKRKRVKGMEGKKWKMARRRIIVLATSGIVKYDRLLVK